MIANVKEINNNNNNNNKKAQARCIQEVRSVCFLENLACFVFL